MTQWSASHQELLDALRAEHILPRLLRRMARERYGASEEEMRWMRELPEVMCKDPGWAILEPVLDTPSAWPDAWARAFCAGFSPISSHHHALFFCRLTTRAAADNEIGLARWAWQQAMLSWRRVLSGDYILRLMAQVVEDDGDEMREVERLLVLSDLLADFVTERVEELAHALGLRRGVDVDGAPPPVDLEVAYYARGALALVMASKGPDPTGALQGAGEVAWGLQECLQVEAIEHLQALLDVQDVAQGASASLVAPFEWAQQVCEVLGCEEGLALAVVDAAVDRCWALRKVERADEDAVRKATLEAVWPVIEEVCTWVLRRDLVGPNAKCADLMVFAGEAQAGPEQRRAHYRRALELCPGHRNAAMLLSYELCAEAEGALLLQGSMLMMRPSAARPMVRLAAQRVREARVLYPSNKRLDALHTQLVAAAARVGVPLEELEQPDDEEEEAP